MSRRVRRAAVALAAVAVVVAAAAVGTGAARERARLDVVAHRRAHATVAEMADLVATRSRTEGLERNIAAAQAAERRHEEATVHIVTAIDELDTLRHRIELAELELGRAREVSDRQAGTLDVLRRCVSALEEARARLVGNDPGGANRALAGAGSSCQQAEAAAEGDTAAHPFDFPDPYVLRVGTSYYAYATNGAAGTIQVLESSGLDDWQVRGSALTAVPAWAQSGYTWAPSAIRTPAGFALFYTVRVRGSQQQCISRALSASPTGPFVDSSPAPLVCQFDLGGSIDPSPFVDQAGTLHLTWKSEGETAGGRGGAQLWSAPLTPDGGALAFFPTRLLGVDRAWEGRTVEGPSMTRTSQGWVLLYSAGRWDSGGYSTGYAWCDGPAGPCQKPSDNQVLRSDGTREGPGGAEFFRTDSGQLKVAYAAWDAGEIGLPNPRRLLIGTASLTPLGLRIS